jgi:hypothetical protein
MYVSVSLDVRLTFAGILRYAVLIVIWAILFSRHEMSLLRAVARTEHTNEKARPFLGTGSL